MASKNIVVATHRPWHKARFENWNPPQGYDKFLIQTQAELTKERLENLAPVYIFFPHWSWIIPRVIHEAFTCVMFHPGDVPFGRGGSPVQNLIVRGIYQTQLSAFQVVEELDAGPVYLKRPLDLTWGSAEEIFEKISQLTFEMIDETIRANPVPKPQEGEVVVWKRRKPEESCIPSGLAPRRLYDFIRMLDAEGYPRAFLACNGYRLEFYNAHLEDGQVTAKSTMTVSA